MGLVRKCQVNCLWYERHTVFPNKQVRRLAIKFGIPNGSKRFALVVRMIIQIKCSPRTQGRGNTMLKRLCGTAVVVIVAVIIYGHVGIAGQAVKKPTPPRTVDQWPNYQNNSNFSPLTQITPANVS